MKEMSSLGSIRYAAFWAVVMNMILLPAPISIRLQFALANTVYTVGDTNQDALLYPWDNPPTSTHYSEWASQRQFFVGDILGIIIYTAPGDVWEVILQFDIALCDHKSPYFLEGGRSGVTYIQLSQVGTSYFITSNQVSCRNGMAVAINVAAASNLTSTSNLNVTLPGAKSYLVGDTNQGTMATPWGLPTTTDHYQQWATNITFNIGDVLAFDYRGQSNSTDVWEVEVTPTMPICSAPSNPWGGGSSGLTFFVVHQGGSSYYVSSNPAFCLGGMRLSIAVQLSPLAPTPAPGRPPWLQPPHPSPPHGPSHSTKLQLSKCGVIGLSIASGMVFLFLCLTA